MLFEGDNVYIVGLTGMSGAGKTTACEVFAENGFCVIDCDIVSRDVVEKGRPALSEISAEFGADVIAPDGTLDRKKLGGIVFASREKLDRLNALIYPYITFEIIRKISVLSNKYEISDKENSKQAAFASFSVRKEAGNGSEPRSEHLFLLDAPTLFESGANVLCDTLVSVTADIKTCAKRIIERDGLTVEQAEKRLSSQHSADFYRERSQYCAENTGTREELLNKLIMIVEDIKAHVPDKEI